jgi:hypothetical protein
MKKPNKPLTFMALVATGAIGLTGCVPPEPKAEMYGPPTDITIEETPPLSLAGDVAIYEPDETEPVKPEETTTENEVCVYGPPADMGVDN